MDWLFASGHAVDLILAVMAAEVLFLLWRRRSPPAAIVLAMMPGALILMALRAALTGAGWPAVAIWLAASFPAHIADLWRRGL